MLEWLTVADDRTGALEVAGEMAPWVGPVTVTVRTPPPAGVAAVVDIGSRHSPVSVAADRAVVAGSAPARFHTHKVDSLLRGNWAHELVAVQRASGGRMLLVPALPRLGRICRGGVVYVDGAAVGGHDARRTTSSPRPAEQLVAAGAGEVVELADAAVLHAWSEQGGSFAVCDASSDEDLAAIAAVWTTTDLRFAGTSGSIAAVVSAAAPSRVDGADGAGGAPPVLAGDVLVVCGSLHPTARAQIDALRSASLAGVTILASPAAAGPAVATTDAERVASELGLGAGDLLAARRFGVLVIIGGDTAAAVLGDDPMVTVGTLTPGVPWSRRADGSGPLVVTKAGGFGRPTTLVDLLADRCPSKGG